MPKDKCLHSWVAGMMVVDSQDLLEIARVRKIECEKCTVTLGKNTDENYILDLMFGEE